MSDTDLEKALSGVAPMRVTDRLYEARTLLISGEVDSQLAQRVTGQLLAMSQESDADITIFIHSQGGHVESGDTIHDMIAFVTPRVKMVGTGWVASAGTHIYLAVPREDRYCLPNTRFLIHQPLGGIGGAATDIQKLRSVSFSTFSSDCPVCFAITPFRRARAFNISSASISMSIACPPIPPNGW
jgi:ATP-dependent Clp endopeptidase proteolytic subunit ClpP